MQRIAVGRIVGLLIAVLGIGSAIYCCRIALRLNAEFHNWVSARPLQASVDLSQPGEVTLPFHQTCSTSHGESLVLTCDCSHTETTTPKNRMDDLRGKVIIRDSAGQEVERLELDGSNINLWQGKWQLASFRPFSRGEYHAAFTIETGAANLRGCNQSLHAEYQLCGLEAMPAVIYGAFAGGFGLVGLIAAVCALPALIKCGIHATEQFPQQGSVSTPAPE